MMSTLIISNLRGDLVITRHFRPGHVCRGDTDLFKVHVVNQPHSPPINRLKHKTCSLHIKRNGLFIGVIVKQDVNAAVGFEFLEKLVGVFEGYFGKLDEDVCRAHFVKIHEFLDEMVDFGYVQTTDLEMIKSRIFGTTAEKVDPFRFRALSLSLQKETTKSEQSSSNAAPWRPPGIKYKKNEAFVDVVETVKALISADGTLHSAEVNGKIVCRAYLSGMPECRIALNDTSPLPPRTPTTPRTPLPPPTPTVPDTGFVQLKDVQYHQCVHFDTALSGSDRVIRFIPPDGEFQLLRYRVADRIRLPFQAEVTVEEVGTTRVEIRMRLASTFASALVATGLEVKVPVPPNAAEVKVEMGTPASGKGKYVAEEDAVIWKVGKLPGEAEVSMAASVMMASQTVRKPWSKPPISLRFHILMLTASGLMVRYLKVEEPSNYHSVKWVRYSTLADNEYQFRYT